MQAAGILFESETVAMVKDMLRIIVAVAVLAGASHAFQIMSSLPAVSRNRLALRPALGAPKTGVLALTSQMVSRDVITEGDGKTFPAEGDTLTVHYEGKLAREGTIFDSSYGGDPFQFVIGEGQVIKGWDRGIMEMSLGEKATLNIAPFFGYGPQGDPPVIPPMSPLVFTIELLAINDQKA